MQPTLLRGVFIKDGLAWKVECDVFLLFGGIFFPQVKPIHFGFCLSHSQVKVHQGGSQLASVLLGVSPAKIGRIIENGARQLMLAKSRFVDVVRLNC